jgi:hypothetical protein
MDKVPGGTIRSRALRTRRRRRHVVSQGQRAARSWRPERSGDFALGQLAGRAASQSPGRRRRDALPRSGRGRTRGRFRRPRPRLAEMTVWCWRRSPGRASRCAARTSRTRRRLPRLQPVPQKIRRQNLPLIGKPWYCEPMTGSLGRRFQHTFAARSKVNGPAQYFFPRIRHKPLKSLESAPKMAINCKKNRG